MGRGQRIGRGQQIAGAALALLVLAACGDQGTGGGDGTEPPGSTVPGAEPEPGAEPDVGDGAQPWLTADGDTLLTCSHDPAFPASLVAEGGLELTAEESEEILAVLEQMKQDFGIDAPGILQESEADQVAWAVLWQEPVRGTDRVGILLAPPGTSDFDLATDDYASLEWQGESWGASSWGGTCRARPVLPAGYDWAQVALDDGETTDGGATTDPTGTMDPTEPTGTMDPTGTTGGTTIDVLVSEIECTSARDPEPFLAEPVVVETAESVTVYWTTEAMTEGADCPGNPWVPRSITLEQPLGDRELLDGSTYPPRIVRTMEEIEGGPPA